MAGDTCPLSPTIATSWGMIGACWGRGGAVAPQRTGLGSAWDRRCEVRDMPGAW